jgi:Sigma-70 region 2
MYGDAAARGNVGVTPGDIAFEPELAWIGNILRGPKADICELCELTVGVAGEGPRAADIDLLKLDIGSGRAVTCVGTFFAAWVPCCAAWIGGLFFSASLNSSDSGLAAADADDLTQEVFIRLYRHLRAGNRVSDLRPWLLRVARICCSIGARPTSASARLLRFIYGCR